VVVALAEAALDSLEDKRTSWKLKKCSNIF